VGFGIYMTFFVVVCIANGEDILIIVLSLKECLSSATVILCLQGDADLFVIDKAPDAIDLTEVCNDIIIYFLMRCFNL